MSNSTAMNHLLEDAAVLVAAGRSPEEPRPSRAPDRAAVPTAANGRSPGNRSRRVFVDPTGTLVEAGWFILQQLKLALGFTTGGVDADRLVPEVLSLARSYGTATPEAIGAAASLVDKVDADDPVELAHVIVAARAALGDDDLAAGISALTAAFSTYIARRIALEPLLVLAELCDRARVAISICPSTIGRSREARPRRASASCRHAGEVVPVRVRTDRSPLR